MKKKILFVMHSMEFGGAERSLINMLCELPQTDYEVELLLFRKAGGFLDQVPEWVHVMETPAVLGRLYAPVSKAGKQVFAKVLGTLCAKAMRRTRKERAAWRWRYVYAPRIQMLDGHYDAAVAFTGVEIMYYVAEKVNADKKIVFIHNDYRTAGYSAADDAPYFAQMDAIVSISKQCVQVLKEEFPQDAQRMHYLENITSSSLIRKRAEDELPKEYNKDRTNILSVGRLWNQKGFDLAVDAAAVLKQQGIDFSWYIIGEGSLRAPLQKQIDALGLSDRFFLLGTRRNPYPYMKHCDMLVQPSRYEGKSVVLDEAKMLCVPIAATAYPTVGDQILDGKEGIITEMSAQGIADGILRIMKDEQLRNELRTYLSEHEYGNQDEIGKYMKILDE